MKRYLSPYLQKNIPSGTMQVEHNVNSRPITKMSVDPKDDEALTPNHFLIGSSSDEIRFKIFDPQTFNHRKQ